MRVVAIVQARMGSTRLPGKVLMDISGKPMLERVTMRLGNALGLDEIVVATTTLPEDDVLATFCEKRGLSCFRGHEIDVADRYYHAARKFQAEVVVRVTADCPLLDGALVDDLIDLVKKSDIDYAATDWPTATFPRGLDAEVFRFSGLERIWLEDKRLEWREHVTPFFYRHPELFALGGIQNLVDLSHERWTVDTPQDLELARLVWAHFESLSFGWRDVQKLLNVHPHWRQLNQGVLQKNVPL